MTANLLGRQLPSESKDGPNKRAPGDRGSAGAGWIEPFRSSRRL